MCYQEYIYNVKNRKSFTFRHYNTVGRKKIPGRGVYVFSMKNRIVGVPGRKESYLAFCFVILN